MSSASSHDSGTTPPSPDLEERVAGLNRVMQACGGGVELRRRDDDGTVHLRLVGMCAGCTCRSVTTATTIEPALSDIDGVGNVRVEGTRISRFAAARLARAFAEIEKPCTPMDGFGCS